MLVRFAAYNLWANTRISREFAGSAPELKLDTDFPGSFSSVRKTLYHIWDAEVIWLNRLKGHGDSVLPIIHATEPFPVFVEKFLTTSLQWKNFVETKPADFFLETLTYRNSKGIEYSSVIGEIAHHVFNHGTYHRGQAINLMRAAGIGPVGSTDFITYTREA